MQRFATGIVALLTIAQSHGQDRMALPRPPNCDCMAGAEFTAGSAMNSYPNSQLNGQQNMGNPQSADFTFCDNRGRQYRQLCEVANSLGVDQGVGLRLCDLSPAPLFGSSGSAAFMGGGANVNFMNGLGFSSVCLSNGSTAAADSRLLMQAMTADRQLGIRCGDTCPCQIECPTSAVRNPLLRQQEEEEQDTEPDEDDIDSFQLWMAMASTGNAAVSGNNYGNPSFNNMGPNSFPVQNYGGQQGAYGNMGTNSNPYAFGGNFFGQTMLPRQNPYGMVAIMQQSGWPGASCRFCGGGLTGGSSVEVYTRPDQFVSQFPPQQPQPQFEQQNANTYGSRTSTSVAQTARFTAVNGRQTQGQGDVGFGQNTYMQSQQQPTGFAGLSGGSQQQQFQNQQPANMYFGNFGNTQQNNQQNNQQNQYFQTGAGNPANQQTSRLVSQPQNPYQQMPNGLSGSSANSQQNYQQPSPYFQSGTLTNANARNSQQNYQQQPAQNYASNVIVVSTDPPYAMTTTRTTPRSTTRFAG